MKAKLLFSVLTLIAFSSLEAQFFHQNFCSSTTVSAYTAASPNTTQFNAWQASGGAVSAQIFNQMFRVSKNGANSHEGSLSRTTALPGNTSGGLIFAFDLAVSENTQNNNAGIIIQLGSSFNSTPGVEANTRVHSQFAINFVNTANTFRLRDITGNNNSSTNQTGTRRITWVVNNTGSTYTYLAPNGSSETVANDRHDIWVGNTRIYNDINAQTGTVNPVNFKITFTNTFFATVDFDNFFVYGFGSTLNQANLSVGSCGEFTSITNPGGLFDVLNNMGGLSSNLNLSISSDLNETGAVALQQISGMNQHTITFRPSSATNRNINGITGIGSNGMIVLNGADNVIFDGRAPGDNSESFSTPRFLSFRNNITHSPVFNLRNGAQNDQIRFCTIEGINNSIANGLVFVGDAPGTTANRNIQIVYNVIRNGTSMPRHGIYLSGTSGRESREIVLRNNEVINCYQPSSSSGYIILGEHLRRITIEGNHLYQTSVGTPGNSATYVSIIGGRSGGSSTNTDTVFILNNYIGGGARFARGAPWYMTTSSNMPMRIRGIDIRFASHAFARVEGNVINNFNMEFPRTTNTNEYSFRGIFINGGVAEVRQNTIGSRDSLRFTCTTNNTAGAISAIGIEFMGNGGIVDGNVVQGITGRAISGGSVASNSCEEDEDEDDDDDDDDDDDAHGFGISVVGMRIQPLFNGLQVRNNRIGNKTQTASLRTASGAAIQSVTGILNMSAGLNVAEIFDNYIGGLCDSSFSHASFARGYHHAGTAGANLYRDTIAQIQSFSPMSTWGINQAVSGIHLSNHTGEVNVRNNLIYSIYAANPINLRNHSAGIVAAGLGTANIHGNRIYDISNRSTRVHVKAPTAAGINTGDKEAGGRVMIYNNMISLGLLPNGSNNTSRTALMGIFDGNDVRSQSVLVAHNSIVIAGSEPGGSNATFAYFRGNFWDIAIPSPLFLYNNILVNARSGNSRNGAIGLEKSNSGWNASNNNILFAVNANNTTRREGSWANLAGWQSAGNQDQNSLYENMAAVNTTLTACSGSVFTNLAQADLHIANCEIRVNARGMVVNQPLAIRTDMDGDFRRGTDIGADEFLHVKTFTGVTNADWNTDSNWDTRQRPSCADSVIVATTGTSIATPAGAVSVIRTPTIATGNTGHFMSLDLRPSTTTTLTGTARLEGCWYDGRMRNRGNLLLQSSTVALAGHLEWSGTSTPGTALWLMNNDSTQALFSNQSGLRNFMAEFNAANDSVRLEGSAQLVELNSLRLLHEGKLSLAGTNSHQTLRIRNTGSLFLSDQTEVITNNRHVELNGSIDSLSTGRFVSDHLTRFRVNGSSSVTGALKFKNGANVVKTLRLNRNAQGRVRLGTSLTVLDSLVMNDGILFTTSENLLTVGQSAKLVGFGSASNYIDGPVVKEFAPGIQQFTFPIGKNGRYRKAEVVNNGGNALRAEFFAAPLSNHWDINARGPEDFEVKNNEYWVIAPPAFSPGQETEITLHWGAETGIVEDNNIMMRLRVLAWNNNEGYFEPVGPTDGSVGGSSTMGFAKSSATSLYGPFGFGVLSSAPLPVELLEFTATPQREDVLLNWTTLSEINNDYFEVYRSFDAEKFNPVGRIPGSGNSNSVKKYELLDASVARLGYNIVYYRLRQVDFNGSFSDSEIIPVQFEQQAGFQLVHAAFNESGSLSGSFTTGSKGRVDVFCYDMNGKLVLQQSLNSNDGVNQFDLNPSAQLAKGVYTLQLVFNGEAQAVKIPRSF